MKMRYVVISMDGMNFSIPRHFFRQPIHTPGAVQGYGVLIALEEDEENGTFIVRQVSEVRSIYNTVSL